MGQCPSWQWQLGVPQVCPASMLAIMGILNSLCSPSEAALDRRACVLNDSPAKPCVAAGGAPTGQAATRVAAHPPRAPGRLCLNPAPPRCVHCWSRAPLGTCCERTAGHLLRAHCWAPAVRALLALCCERTAGLMLWAGAPLDPCCKCTAGLMLWAHCWPYAVSWRTAGPLL